MKEQEKIEEPGVPEVIELAELEQVWGAGGAESYAGVVCETMLSRIR